jgi:hypothetical protein
MAATAHYTVTGEQPDRPDACHRLFREEAVVGRGAAGAKQEAVRVVEAKRLHRHTGTPRKAADAHRFDVSVRHVAVPPIVVK